MDIVNNSFKSLITVKSRREMRWFNWRVMWVFNKGFTKMKMISAIFFFGRDPIKRGGVESETIVGAMSFRIWEG